MVSKVDSHRKHVICNGDEGDPGAFMDRSVLEGDPHRVLGHGHCGVRDRRVARLYLRAAEYPLAIKNLKTEIMHAILDRRIDAKRAGLLLYSLQLASSNLHNLQPMPLESEPLIVSIGSDDEEVFNDTIAEDEEEPCNHKCDDCAEEDCADRKVRAPKVHTRSAAPRKPPTRVTQPPGSSPVPASR